MITDSFDNNSEAKINPYPKDGVLVLDYCIVIFARHCINLENLTEM